MKNVIYLCDVCKKPIDKSFLDKLYKGDKLDKGIKLSVIFTTEQNEGRCVEEPYIDWVYIHLCEKCYKYILEGNMLFAHGAMGYNDYYFKKKGDS